MFMFVRRHRHENVGERPTPISLRCTPPSFPAPQTAGSWSTCAHANSLAPGVKHAVCQLCHGLGFALPLRFDAQSAQRGGHGTAVPRVHGQHEPGKPDAQRVCELLGLAIVNQAHGAVCMFDLVFVGGGGLAAGGIRKEVREWWRGAALAGRRESPSSGPAWGWMNSPAPCDGEWIGTACTPPFPLAYPPHAKRPVASPFMTRMLPGWQSA